MTSIPVESRPMRRLLLTGRSAWMDLFLLGLVLSAVGILLHYAHEADRPFLAKSSIDTSASALPGYAGLTLARGLIAYVLSLLFTLVYGWIAAHSARANRVMVPLLDILQTLPVLMFLWPVQAAMIVIFPDTSIGLEITVIIMVFTGQAWNMTFSFYQSLRTIPPALHEVARVNGFGPFRTFAKIELPASMIGLVYNSMVSFAGGWFFITSIELFTVNTTDYALPGIGSWLVTVQQEGHWGSMAIGLGVMALMIILVDQLIFRPVLVWAQRFRMEDQASTGEESSWLVAIWRRSPLLQAFRAWRARRRGGDLYGTVHGSRMPRRVENSSTAPRQGGGVIARISRWVAVLLAMGLIGWGGWGLVDLLMPLPFWTGSVGLTNEDASWVTAILGLLASFVRVLIVVGVSTLWAVPLGLLIGRSPRARRLLGPIVQLVASFPAPMFFIALVVVFMSIGVPFELICLVLMVAASAWYIVYNVMAGSMSLPTELREVGRVNRLSGVTRLKKIVLPAVFPFLVTGWLTAMGGAWNATIVSEYIDLGADDGHEHVETVFGIGALITVALNEGNSGLLAACAVVLGIFVVLLSRLFWRRLYRLCETRYNLSG